MTNNSRISALVTIILAALVLGGCSSTPEEPQKLEQPIYGAQRMLPEDVQDPTAIYDPFQSINRRIFNFNYHFDNAIFLPAARAYQWILPQFMEDGAHNFFNNFREVRNLANSILQLNAEKTAQVTGRLMVNTTIGLLGFIDVATDMGIPSPNEDFGQTLGHWGVGTGPYVVVPFLGPSNMRDGLGLLPDFWINTTVRDEVFAKDWRIPFTLLDAVDTRANLPFRYYENGTAFEYETLRWLYTTKRQLDVAK